MKYGSIFTLGSNVMNFKKVMILPYTSSALKVIQWGHIHHILGAAYLRRPVLYPPTTLVA